MGRTIAAPVSDFGEKRIQNGMNSFVRFIFLLMLLGSTLAFGIVLVADIHGSREREENTIIEKDRFTKLISQQSGRVRRLEIAVEWQQINASQQVMQSSLLIRRYGLDEEGNEVALPVQRTVIPKNVVEVDGLMMQFGPGFSGEFSNLQNTKLAYFSHVYGQGESLKDRFQLMEDGRVPAATRMHLDHLTYYELKLWKYLWYLIQNPKQAKKADLEVKWMQPRTWAVANGSVYSVFVGYEGVTYAENNDPTLLADMLQEAAAMDDANAAPKAVIRH